jgi:divalent metal cation (Fe/Co/Zn/Cd) transporter
MLFGISGILSLQQGFASLTNPSHQIQHADVSYVILVISAAFEANSLRIALEFSRHSIEAKEEKLGIRSLINEFHESKDPSLITILVEDSAALLGIAIAGVGIFLSEQTGNSIYDSISSLSIGCILIVFAFFLAKENKGLLIGESISRRDYKKVVGMIKKIPEVNRIITMRSMYLAPKDVLVTIEVNLIDGLNTDQIESVIDNIENNVKQAIPYVNPSRIYVELERDRFSDLYKRRRRI